MNRFVDFHEIRSVRRITQHLPMPLIEEARERLEYDPETGQVFNRKTGKELGIPAKHRRNLLIFCQGLSYPKTRMCWFLQTGVDPEDLVIVPRDGDRTNTRFKNLEAVSLSEAQSRAGKKRHAA